MGQSIFGSHFLFLEGSVVAHGTAIAFFVAATDHHGLAVDHQVLAFRFDVFSHDSKLKRSLPPASSQGGGDEMETVE